MNLLVLQILRKDMAHVAKKRNFLFVFFDKLTGNSDKNEDLENEDDLGYDPAELASLNEMTDDKINLLVQEHGEQHMIDEDEETDKLGNIKPKLSRSNVSMTHKESIRQQEGRDEGR